MEYEPKGNELIFYFENYTFNCDKNGNKIICKAPINIFPRLERLHLYSYLSCFNKIDVGWFELNDVNIFSIYNLINYDFNYISNIYIPSSKITEYNPAMINYYYWFSCFSYCDDKNIKQKNCCNDILNEWEIVFHKEYSHEKGLFELITDSILGIINLGEIYNDFDFGGYVTDLVGESSSFVGKIIKKSKGILEKIPVIAIPLIEQLTNAVYKYHFVILKNDNYKKIVVAFPGITYYFQIIEEFLHAGMIELPFKSKNKYFNVLEFYYDLFTTIEKDLFDNLESLPGIKDKNYQVIFIGHSLGGAIATLSSFYYIKKYNYIPENILITFGQPKVGSEVFAKELTNDLKQIYRIARPSDIATQFPLKGIDYLFKYIKSFKLIIDIMVLAGQILTLNIIGAIMTIQSYFGDGIESFVSEYSYLVRDSTFQDVFYSQIGGLYMIDDEPKKVYHCDNFFNEKREHFICKNHDMKLSYLMDFFHNRKYLSKEQDMISSCQKKKIKIFRFSTAFSVNDVLLRRLQNTNKKKYEYNIQRNRKLDNIQTNQETLKLFEEIYLQKNISEYCYRYQSEDVLKYDNLFLIINPRNNHFFGEICFSQNITWLINNEYNSLNCYYINVKYPISLRIELINEIIDEKELYIYIKGEVSGTLELFDYSKNKELNLFSSYIIPYINNFPSGQSINIILPKIENNIYMNIIINNYGIDENKTLDSIFEVYNNKEKINYKNNYFLLEKDKKYYFKYYPNQYELIINFIHNNLNQFLEKKFYVINEQNIYINYYIDNKENNSSFGMFFEFNGVINIKGYFSNSAENKDNIDDYNLKSNNKYFILRKNDKFNYLNLKINVNSDIISHLIIYEIKKVITISKMNSIYEIKKTGNYIFLLNEIIHQNHSKFESYILISINNKNNILKLITSNGDIIISKNFVLMKLFDINGIFIKVDEDDIFTIKIIPEEISKYMIEGSSTYFGNTFIDDKKYSIEFIHNEEKIYVYYNYISANLKIYELNNESFFNLEDIINYKINNYSLLLGLKTFEEQYTHIILKESSGPFLYEKFINNLIINFNYFLDSSKICYLLMDFEYFFSYNKKINKILLKVLNNDSKQASIKILCENNSLIEFKDNIKEINLEQCNGEFIMSGNNSLIYFYLPLTLNDSYTIIDDEENEEDSFELYDVKEFFFVPKKYDFNSINILITFDYKQDDYPIYFVYYIEYGIIPYSRNIEKKRIFLSNSTNIIIPNFSNYSIDNEKYFIFFKFNTTISKIKAHIIYENIIYLDDKTYLFLKSGIHNIKVTRNKDHYLNITKINDHNEDNSYYSIYKNEKRIETHKISDKNNMIYIQEPSYNENIKLKIENDVNILLSISSEYFQNFSSISYNTNLNIKQNGNILDITFNSTNFNSKLEYYIALIEEEDKITPILIHEKFFENDLIYKNIIHSFGNEPIETNFFLKDDFIYNKNYTAIAYGKDTYGENFNYFYFEPKTIYIIEPNIINTEESTINVISKINTNYINDDTNNINSETNIKNAYEESTFNIISEISNNYINDDIININNETNNKNVFDESTHNIINDSIFNDEKGTDGNGIIDNEKEKEKKLNTVVIVIIVFLAVSLIVTGIIVGLICYRKKKIANKAGFQRIDNK